MGDSEFSFTAFSQQDFYRRVNEWLIDRVGLQRGWAVVDVACGCGAVTELIAERIRGGREAVVTGLDLSADALKDAKERFVGVRDVVVEFVQARAEEMSQVLRRAADAVVFCNGIHYIEDKDQLLSEVHRTLPPGGVFAFNTTFFNGAHLPETDRFYRRWMLKTLRRLRERYDLKPERAKVESRQQWTAEQYRDLLQSGGFEVKVAEMVPVQVTEEGWIAISRYTDFIAGVLPGISLKTASDLLCETVSETLSELGVGSVPRNWFSVIAARAA
jgi:ubiquinone/menaquinone biosynthesis C-methylase UbiE